MSRVLSLVVNKKENKDNFIYNMINRGKEKDSLVDIEEKLREWGVEYEVKNPNHIKIGLINYYISTGACYIDGTSGKFKRKGLKFLKQILKIGGII